MLNSVTYMNSLLLHLAIHYKEPSIKVERPHPGIFCFARRTTGKVWIYTGRPFMNDNMSKRIFKERYEEAK